MPKMEKRVDDKTREEESIEKQEIKTNWGIIVLTGFITSSFFVLIDVIFVLIVIFGFHKTPLIVLGVMEYILLGETGLVILWGA
ncbi:MAG: hypothetical protein ACTSPI_16165, partial [Candidatus Heimdallarchaeaceae archaeon]